MPLWVRISRDLQHQLQHMEYLGVVDPLGHLGEEHVMPDIVEGFSTGQISNSF